MKNENKKRKRHYEEVQSTDVVISLNKELTNKESLFARYAWLLRLPLRAKALLTMTVSTFALAMVLSIGIISESRAACENNQTCGTDCCWIIENGTLKISGTGAMTDYEKSSAPWDSYKSSITSVDIGNGITNIGTYSFYNMSGVTSLNIPNSVIGIKKAAFEGMSGVTGKLVIPDSVTSIGDFAFKNMSSVSSLSLSDSLVSIGTWALEGMTSLRGTMILPDSVESIEHGTFHRIGYSSLVLSDSITSTGTQSFRYTGSISEIVIPDYLDTSLWPSDAFVDMNRNTSKVIRCQGDVNICKTNLARFGTSITNKIYAVNNEAQCTGKYVWDNTTSKCNRMNEEQCNEVEKYYYNSGVCKNLPTTSVDCENANFSWNSSSNKCFKTVEENTAFCYAKGQVFWKNACLDEYPFVKKRWTPAEANEWLHDGNDNFVIITFKK